MHSKNDIVVLTKTFVIYVAGPCKLYSYLLKKCYHHSCCGQCCGHMIRKGCDCVVHGREVWTGVQICNSHNKGLC